MSTAPPGTTLLLTCPNCGHRFPVLALESEGWCPCGYDFFIDVDDAGEASVRWEADPAYADDEVGQARVDELSQRALPPGEPSSSVPVTGEASGCAQALEAAPVRPPAPVLLPDPERLRSLTDGSRLAARSTSP